MVIESKHRLAEHLAHLHQRLGRATRYRLLMARNHLQELSQHGAFARIQDLMVRRSQRLDELSYRLAANYRTLLHDYRRRLDIAASRVRHYDFRRSLAIVRSELDAGTEAVVHAFQSRLAAQRSRVERLAAQLNALSPVKILERGYALVFDESGALVKDVSQLAAGSEISAQVARGRFTAEVKKTSRD
jgi:exodeoxyribonuclease VII large subunit